MSKELECLDRIDKRNYLTEREHKEFLGVVEKALTEYEAIKNAEPSEALDCLETIWCDISTNYINEYVAIKQALLKAQDNARSEEILQKYYQEGITLDSVRALKLRIEALEKDLEEQRELAKHYLEEQEKEIIELRQKAQEPKHYLKWEDLEFNIEKQMMTVLLNGTKYTLDVGCNVHFDKLAILRNGKINYYFLEADKQFFNDLRLERVKE